MRLAVTREAVDSSAKSVCDETFFECHFELFLQPQTLPFPDSSSPRVLGLTFLRTNSPASSPCIAKYPEIFKFPLRRRKSQFSKIVANFCHPSISHRLSKNVFKSHLKSCAICASNFQKLGLLLPFFVVKFLKSENHIFYLSRTSSLPRFLKPSNIAIDTELPETRVNSFASFDRTRARERGRDRKNDQLTDQSGISWILINIPTSARDWRTAVGIVISRISQWTMLEFSVHHAEVGTYNTRRDP